MLFRYGVFCRNPAHSARENTRYRDSSASSAGEVTTAPHCKPPAGRAGVTLFPMPSRSRPTQAKRAREKALIEKRQMKTARRIDPSFTCANACWWYAMHASTNAMVRRLGGRRWLALHKVIYVIGPLAVLHFWWMVKRDLTEPILYALILAVLLGYRIRDKLREKASLRAKTNTRRVSPVAHR